MNGSWPPLPLESWRPTLETLHRCAQIVGKVQLQLMPPLSHYWQVAFEVMPWGLATPAIPFERRTFGVELDFIEHVVHVRTSDGGHRSLALVARPVADFYADFMDLLARLGIRVSIHDRPVEIPGATLPFHEDREHAAYEREPVERWWQIILQSTLAFEEFRGWFVGKSSPVQFYWGSFDLAISRFSGRRAPEMPGADLLHRECYSHEVSTAGFWPGDERYPQPAYYAYTMPAPADFARARVAPAEAFWHPQLGEFLLPYEAVRASSRPRERILDFLESTYAAAADLGGWDRAALERREPPPGPRPESAHPPPA